MTTKGPDMKKLPRVKKVKDSTQWHYWRKVPKNLLDHPVYQGKTWARRESLKTPDLREANRLGGVRLMGHKTYLTTQRYEHLDVDDVRDAVKALE